MGPCGMTMNYSSKNFDKSHETFDRLVRHLIQHGITISAMESCTGGLFSSYLTDTEGASEVFLGSFVTYSNEAKIRNGVPDEVIDRFGVYSAETAEAMAGACRDFYHADIGVGITGTTGNADPNNPDSSPGEVFYAIIWGEKKCTMRMLLEDAGLSRHEMKERIVGEVGLSLAGLLEI